MLTMTDSEKKLMITDLQNLNKKVELIDFLRKYLQSEYKEIFQKELGEEILIAKSKLSGSCLNIKGFDIRKYSYRLLMNYLPGSLKISRNYSWLKLYKVLVFFENILPILKDDYKKHTASSKKITDYFSIYRFFKSLMSCSSCLLSDHQEALNILRIKLYQEDIDNDSDAILHDLLIHNILDNFLFPFIEEFNNLEHD
jgi:hypothetical protein